MKCSFCRLDFPSRNALNEHIPMVHSVLGKSQPNVNIEDLLQEDINIPVKIISSIPDSRKATTNDLLSIFYSVHAIEWTFYNHRLESSQRRTTALHEFSITLGSELKAVLKSPVAWGQQGIPGYVESDAPIFIHLKVCSIGDQHDATVEEFPPPDDLPDNFFSQFLFD